MAASLKCFAICAPGLEPFLAAELDELSIRGDAIAGGVEFPGSESSVAIANLNSRIASRIVVRIASFRARTFFELERHAKKVEWEKYIPEGADIQFRITAKKSKLYHTGAIAQRLQDAISKKLKREVAINDPSDEDEGRGHQLFIVRFERDECVVSADTSGELLHRRGYRQAIAKAPLRETLAAAMLRAAGWDGKASLVDPMCGSGTIPIEAAMMARGIPPGLNRDFAFLRWPGADKARWNSLVDHARAKILKGSPARIAASDRDEGAIAAAKANAERAGVAGDIDFSVRPISAAESIGKGPGLLIANPPYGERIGASDTIRNLYAQMGNTARKNFPGWRVALLSPGKQLDAQLKIVFEERFKTSNGGIPVRFVVGDVDG